MRRTSCATASPPLGEAGRGIPTSAHRTVRASTVGRISTRTGEERKVLIQWVVNLGPHMLPSVVMITLALSVGCDGRSARPAVAPADAALPVIEVHAAQVRRGAVTQSISAPGSLVARRESHIGTEVAGRIVQVFVSEGDRVEAGAPLFQIDPAPYEMALRQAEAGLDVARAERLQLEADLARAQTLRRQSVMAQQEHRPARDRARRGAGAASGRPPRRVALARHNLERTLVRAPYAGSVAQRDSPTRARTALVQPQTIVVVLQETDELEARRGDSREPAVAGPASATRRGCASKGLPSPIADHGLRGERHHRPGDPHLPGQDAGAQPGPRLKAGVFAHVEILPQPKRDVAARARARRSAREDGRTRLLVVRDGRAQAVPVADRRASPSRRSRSLHGADAKARRSIVGEAARTIAPGMRVRGDRRRAAPPA